MVIKFKIKEYLKENNISLYKVCKDTGLAYPQLHKTINNKGNGMSTNTLGKICTALNCKIEDLIYLAEE